MRFRTAHSDVSSVSPASVELKSGDVLTVGYTDPQGKSHIIVIQAQHLVLVARHEGSDAAIVCNPRGAVAVNN